MNTIASFKKALELLIGHVTSSCLGYISNVSYLGDKSRTLSVRFYFTPTGSLVALLLFIGYDGM
jgi:hypothetical protein